MNAPKLEVTPNTRGTEPGVCSEIKVFAEDRTYLGKTSLQQAEAVILAGLGKWVRDTLFLSAKAHRVSTSGTALNLAGMRPHDRQTKDNVRGVWTFRKGQ